MIRSTLTLYNVTTGSQRTVLQSDQVIEAPNWSPCGTFLIVNGNGALFRLNLDDTSKLIPIKTGTLTALNNDHGISPDGATLAISDSPGRGTSCIYTVPITGGSPTRITENTPSYWHGWSPDGQTLTYTAKRGDHFNLFTIPVAGGDEMLITFGPGHKDGPDYTPDGDWIWFNSDHDGTMDLWRVRPYGADLEQMTSDQDVNWFPHPSPDGRHILFLAYAPGTQGHPADRKVALKLMSPDGSDIRTLVQFTGGQGSINVPNWAPDGTQFAYIHYTI